eukprot:TRINITY_DN6408_c0_g1_i2.p1 TRINITY_DN6408_c0_g1~~TRINITY_DN6408_c0_g1_i2.p1  ORF type:complete len:257 (-),score=40.69 TRINITY_DN6408_c0_g1_i2:8-778(-)
MYHFVKSLVYRNKRKYFTPIVPTLSKRKFKPSFIKTHTNPKLYSTPFTTMSSTTNIKENKKLPTLQEVTSLLNQIAPLHLAESWDNVGLLVEPYFTSSPSIKSVLLSNDFSKHVLDEAIELNKKEPTSSKTLLIVYHPVLFTGVKRVTYGNGSTPTSLVVKALSHEIPIYCPHTALDSVEGGINDWLCGGIGEGTSEIIQPYSSTKPTEAFKIVVFCPEDNVDTMREALSKAGAGIIGNYEPVSYTHLTLPTKRIV